MKRKVRSQTVTAIEDQDDGVETRVRRMTILRSLSVDDPSAEVEGFLGLPLARWQ